MQTRQTRKVPETCPDARQGRAESAQRRLGRCVTELCIAAELGHAMGVRERPAGCPRARGRRRLLARRNGLFVELGCRSYVQERESGGLAGKSIRRWDGR